MRHLLLFLLLPIGVIFAQEQTGNKQGVWVLDNVASKDSSKIESTVIPLENIAPELVFDFPKEINIQSDQVSVILIDGTAFENIFFKLDHDILKISIIPSKTSTYKVRFENDLIILNQMIDTVEYTYIYKSKK